MTNTTPAFHVMAKPTGSKCNLDCAYCFYLKKEQMYPDSDFRMSDEVMEQYLRQTIEGHRVPHVTIAWQGGEPTLMGLDFFQRAGTLWCEQPVIQLAHILQRRNRKPHSRLATSSSRSTSCSNRIRR